MATEHLNLDGLRRQFDALCDRLGAAPKYRGYFQTRLADDGSAHLEIAGGTYHWVVTERGKELERRQTADPDEVLYWLMSAVTLDLALRWELAHRRPAEDVRRQYFAEHERLLRSLRDDWGDALAARHQAILAEYPFKDPGPAG